MGIILLFPLFATMYLLHGINSLLMHHFSMYLLRCIVCISQIFALVVGFSDPGITGLSLLSAYYLLLLMSTDMNQ